MKKLVRDQNSGSNFQTDTHLKVKELKRGGSTNRIQNGKLEKSVWLSVQDLAKPIICNQVDSIWLARDWFCKHQPIFVWGRGMARLGKVGKKWAWQVGRLQLPPLDQTLVCALAIRGFRLRSQMSHLALSLRTGLGRIMRKIGVEVIERHLGI